MRLNSLSQSNFQKKKKYDGEKQSTSAGLPLIIATISRILDVAPTKGIVGTGAIWPDGTVHKVRGMIQKLEAAAALGAKTFLISKELEEEYNKLKDEQKKGIAVIFVSHFSEVYELLFPAKGVK
ncbi:hypothetical protein ACQ4LE_003712 [Meloidogyne hapla]